MFPSTIDRHQRRNHPNDTFEKGKHIRCKDHEDVKNLEAEIEKIVHFSKRVSASQPDFSERASASQPNFAERDSASQSDIAERVSASESALTECASTECASASQPDFAEHASASQSDFSEHVTAQQIPEECESSLHSPVDVVSSFQRDSVPSSSAEMKCYQKSIDGFVSNQSLNEVPRKMKPASSTWTLDQIGEAVLDVKSTLMKIIPTSHQGSPALKDSSPSTAALYKCNNLNEVLSTELFTIVQHQNERLIRCSACHKYATRDELITKFSTQFKLPSSGLSVGVSLAEDKIEDFQIGHSQAWYNFKSRLVAHIRSGKDSFHWKATHDTGTTGTPSMIRSVSVTETLCRTAIHVLKMKGAAVHFETEIAFLQSCKVDVGDIGHSRNNFPEILRAATVVICRRNLQMLLRPLLSTGLPPHIYLTADKSTLNRHTNQAILLVVNLDGKRIAVPVGAPPVYSVANTSDSTVQLVGGSAEALADSIIDTILEKTGLPEHHLTQLTGATCDGQYVVSPAFATRLAERVGVPSDNIFAFPVTWDAGHWMNLVVTDVRNVKQPSFKSSSQFLNTFIKRCNVFSDELQRGKGYAMLRATAEASKSIAHAPKSYAQHRFTSSNFQQWLSIEKSLPALVEGFHAMNPRSKDDPNEELKFMIQGQDFVYDLLFLLDFLGPLVQTMNVLQDFAVPIWKVVKFTRSLINHWESISVSTLKGLPRLSMHQTQLEMFKYNGLELLTGYLVVHQEKGKVAWEARELVDCRAAAEIFKRDFVTSLKNRSKRCIHEASTALEECFDLHGIFAKICGERSKKKSAYDKTALALHGVSSFNKFVDYVSNLPQVKSSDFLDINPVLSITLYDKLKETLVASV
ncbi:uncharacterized protein LOC108671228 [Hyalella azteca]|uniref:Uncharacterized protein LOC108671228 n=1 Tax=Hyalella azteca TaxID=294128 RepID=A0A8B7NKM4_HYAAZ|nr:uncharacterized protein LOC108671228 [Hyalella azteca]